MELQGMTVGRPKGLRHARTLRWTGVPRVDGVREVATATGRLGWAPPQSRARVAGEAAGLKRERARLQDELGARQVVQAQLDARMRAAGRRLAIVCEKGGKQP